MNHKWNYQPITPEQAETSQTLAQELGISPILGQLLVQRGITKAVDAKKFFRPQLPDLHDPFLMNDMDIAVERLNKAMGKKERILIYGDVDFYKALEYFKKIKCDMKGEEILVKGFSKQELEKILQFCN